MSSEGQPESRGPRRGARKLPDDYSNHPSSKRVRTWKANMTEEERDLNRAKNSLYQAIRRAKERLKKQDNWITGDDGMKKRLEEEATEVCHQKARVKGDHPDQISQRVSAAAASIDSLGIPWDDGDETWEDEEIEDENFTAQDMSRQEIYDGFEKLRENNMTFAFLELKKEILFHMTEMFAKIRRFYKDPLDYMEYIIQDLQNDYPDEWETKIIGWPIIFSPIEIRVWKLLGAAIKAPKLSPKKAAKRIIRCYMVRRGLNLKSIYNLGRRRRRSIEKYVPTLAEMIRTILSLPLEAKLRDSHSIWETLPGPANIWIMDEAETEQLKKILEEGESKETEAKAMKHWIISKCKKAPSNFSAIFDALMEDEIVQWEGNLRRRWQEEMLAREEKRKRHRKWVGNVSRKRQ